MATILLKMTEQLPGQYLFDVVTNNFAALELVSRKVYGSVWVAEEKGSALDGRTAAAILREVRGTGRRRRGQRNCYNIVFI